MKLLQEIIQQTMWSDIEKELRELYDEPLELDEIQLYKRLFWKLYNIHTTDPSSVLLYEVKKNDPTHGEYYQLLGIDTEKEVRVTFSSATLEEWVSFQVEDSFVTHRGEHFVVALCLAEMYFVTEEMF